jgi:hypothetical protein
MTDTKASNMQENIEKIIKRSKQLEQLEEKAEKLEEAYNSSNCIYRCFFKLCGMNPVKLF